MTVTASMKWADAFAGIVGELGFRHWEVNRRGRDMCRVTLLIGWEEREELIAGRILGKYLAGLCATWTDPVECGFDLAEFFRGRTGAKLNDRQAQNMFDFMEWVTKESPEARARLMSPIEKASEEHMKWWTARVQFRFNVEMGKLEVEYRNDRCKPGGRWDPFRTDPMPENVGELVKLLEI